MIDTQEDRLNAYHWPMKLPTGQTGYVLVLAHSAAEAREWALKCNYPTDQLQRPPILSIEGTVVWVPSE